MSDEEFIEAYAQGRISRRVFVRRLVAGGLTLSAALAYSDSIGAGLASASRSGRKPPKPPPHSKHHKP